MWVLTIVVLWATAYFTLPLHANGFWAPKAIVWIIGSWLLGSAIWWNPPQATFQANRWMGRLAAWIVIVFAIGFFLPQLFIKQTTASEVPIPFNVWPIQPFLYAMGSFLALHSLVIHAANVLWWRKIAWHLFLIGIVCAIHGIAQVLWADPMGFSRSVFINYTAKNAPIGLLGNPTLFGNFLALVAPFGLIFKPPWTRFGWFLMVSAIVLTKSATSLIGLFLGTVVVLLLHRHWRTLLVFLLIVLAGAWWQWEILPSFLNPQGRLEMWARAWEFFIKFPLSMWIGYGLGTVAELTRLRHWSYGMLHNEPLQIMVELGFIGLFLTVMWVGTSARSWWSLRKNSEAVGWIASLTVFAVLACFGFPLRIAPLAMVGVLAVAALESLKGDQYAIIEREN